MCAVRIDVTGAHFIQSDWPYHWIGMETMSKNFASHIDVTGALL
jgi:hypothetical protein